MSETSRPRYPQGGVVEVTGEGLWISGTEVANPGAGATLVDTGAIDHEGDFLFAFFVAFILSASAGMVAHIQLVDTDGTTVLKQQLVPVPGGGFSQPYFGNKMTVLKNQRVRVTTRDAETGTLQASIFQAEVA